MESSEHSSMCSMMELRELESELEAELVAELESSGLLLGAEAGSAAGPVVVPSLKPPPPPPPPPSAWPPLLRQASRKGGAGRRSSARRRSLKGPIRALRLCLFAVVLPGLLVAGPLYLRFHVYADQVYPLAMSDMRLLDGRVSTTWCQRQVVRTNATFNAFLLPESPRVAPEPQHVSMVRELLLEDDMKEYWAFYLLRGSLITVSSCVRWPGASLIVIRGHRHLHDCAYIGDNSSEEADEEEEAADVMEAAAAEAAAAAARAREGEGAGSKEGADGGHPSAESNEPRAMRRARPGVLLNGREPLASQERITDEQDNEPDDEALKHILHKVAQKRASAARRRLGIVGGEGAGMEGGQDHGAASETGSRNRQPPDSAEVFEDVLKKLRALGPRGRAVLRRINSLMEKDKETAANTTGTAEIQTAMDKTVTTGTAGASAPAAASTTKERVESGTAGGPMSMGLWGAELRAAPAAAYAAGGASMAGLAEASPSTLSVAAPHNATDNSSADPLADPGALNALRELVRQMMREHEEEMERDRNRRSIWMLGSAADDEELDNAAVEEVEENMGELKPDGIADHHERINETEAGDLDSSNSEFWSSFSSSEEKLLSCAGLVLNLPLHPHHQCRSNAPAATLNAASAHNTLTYRIPTNGYYFFVFSSENEIQTNYIRSNFNLERVVYNVSSPVAACRNSTQSCALPLDFFSSEKLVLEMPVRSNASLWNEEFLVVSSCEPRTALYVACIVAVPFLIVIFAFQ